MADYYQCCLTADYRLLCPQREKLADKIYLDVMKEDIAT